MTNAQDPRAVRTRQALHAALLDLLERKPFADITIRELVAEAGIGYTTFFRHHPTRESLLEDIAAEQIGALIELSVTTLNSSDLRSASEAIFTHVDQRRALWSTLLTGGAAGTIREEFLHKAREAALPMGAADDKVPVDCGIVLIVSGTIELIDWWLRSRQPLSVQRVAEIHELVVVSPIMQANRFNAPRMTRRRKQH
jgi:AcrR family transcriptional regulator